MITQFITQKEVSIIKIISSKKLLTKIKDFLILSSSVFNQKLFLIFGLLLRAESALRNLSMRS